VVLGFSGLQLSGAERGVTLAALNDSGRLTATVTVTDSALPGDGTQRAALGYLHANCGSCHRPKTQVFDEQTRIDLWLRLGKLDTLEVTPTFESTVYRPTMVGDEPELLLVAPGDAQASALWLRMAARDRRAMPPLASEQVDAEGLALMAAFIDGLVAP